MRGCLGWQQADIHCAHAQAAETDRDRGIRGGTGKETDPAAGEHGFARTELLITVDKEAHFGARHPDRQQVLSRCTRSNLGRINPVIYQGSKTAADPLQTGLPIAGNHPAVSVPRAGSAQQQPVGIGLPAQTGGSGHFQIKITKLGLDAQAGQVAFDKETVKKALNQALNQESCQEENRKRFVESEITFTNASSGIQVANFLYSKIGQHFMRRK